MPGNVDATTDAEREPDAVHYLRASEIRADWVHFDRRGYGSFCPIGPVDTPRGGTAVLEVGG